MTSRVAALLLTAAVIVGVSACTPEPRPAPDPTTAAAEPDTSLVRVALSVAEGVDAGPADGRTVSLPPGWSAEVWAEVPGARLGAWDAAGRFVVSTGDRGELRVLTPARGSAPTSAILLADLDNPQGVAFTQRNGRELLVLGEGPRIVVWDYTDGEATDRRVLVDDLPTGGHGAKAVAVTGDTVFYSLGSRANRDPADREATPERATIWRVGLDGADNRVVATGVRNGFGLDIAPDGTLFTAVNQADDQPYPFDDDGDGYGRTVRDYVNENPVEQVTRVVDGSDLGWPLCVPDTRDATDLTDIPFVPDPQFNADGSVLDCATLAPTMLGIPAHSAPLGLAFTAGTPAEASIGSGALITSHGSWNRTPPRAPSVVFSAWDDTTATLQPPETILSGFQGDDGERWGRPVTAVPGPDGSLYVTDDDAGLIYRLTPGT